MYKIKSYKNLNENEEISKDNETYLDPMTIISNIDNLDLKSYNPFIDDFEKYSDGTYKYHMDKLYKPKSKHSTELRRTTENERKITEKYLRGPSGQEHHENPVTVNAEDVNKILK